ncbi:ABC-F type ribosomal protection protein [Sedimentibacter sp. zth1]|uniref:ribosomal protection-like ABC-F family protein n=1 Tax=Sedimentibacter sp. zth1 TaxID=2816908 RepID=UPI001A91AD73|nr:ABC-F type ribosomal protection protein [Sedimentibacter sp. zth1]QSX06744.1 ABC-F type ribosomal protection protein [Sedimentibacter sp. zth1]
MSKISVKNLTFSYETNYQNIFENTSFEIDTDWKLGFIGRNGKGKTTFLNLLMGKYKYQGTISSSVEFEYFPFEVNENDNTLSVVRNSIAPFDEWNKRMNECIEENSEESINEYGNLLDLFMLHDGFIIDELIEKEIRKLDVDVNVLNRNFNTLSNGEKTKLLLAALFLKKKNFLLIDEPTNHLDLEGRECVAEYLNSKKGFILVSHDRYFVDKIIDHIISINKSNIEIQKGNFSSYSYNKELQDNFEIATNEKLKGEIKHLEYSFRRSKGWSDLVEKTKIGNGPCDRGAIGAQSARMMKKAKNLENRIEKNLDEKKSLLKNIERVDNLKIYQLEYFKDNFVNIQNLSISYGDNMLLENISFTINKGDRVAIKGKNGSGKSSIIKLVLGDEINYTGDVKIGSNLMISYISQDTSYLNGKFRDFTEHEGINETLFRAMLAKLDFSPILFDKKLEELSMGQKKKVLIAKSLCEKSHLHIWDEPLNYIDVISRMQIEKLILEYEPTLLFVEHDYMFSNNIATKEVNL